MTVLPRHVLCVLGNWTDFNEVDSVLQAHGPGFELDREYSLLEPDDRMLRSFDVCYERYRPTMTAEDWNAVENHTAVAYVLSPPIEREQSFAISGQALTLTAALLCAGGVAAKDESPGIAHGRTEWLRLAAQFSQAHSDGQTHSAWGTLYQAFVRRPLLDDDEILHYTCGMHLLGEPDLEIASEVELDTAIQWIDLLGLYLAADRPAAVRDGEGFRLSDAGPRKLLRLAPCERYEEDSFKFNPYGYIRLVDPS